MGYRAMAQKRVSQRTVPFRYASATLHGAKRHLPKTRGGRMRTETIDLNFLGTEHVIASFLLLGDGSAALVETGPTTCLDSLTGGLKEHGVASEDVDQVFLTHIHLDHAGASGHLAELLPNATFYVHEVGRPHLVD